MYYSDQQNDEAPVKPIPGRFGSANTQSYTYPFQIVCMAILGFFIFMDSRPEGAGFFRTAFGVRTNFLVWACYLGGFLIVSFITSNVTAGTYYRITNRTFIQDRVGYALAGGSDINFWSGFLPLVTTVLIFGFFVPPGFLGWARSLVIFFLSAISGYILVKLLTDRVYAISLRQWFLMY